MCNTNARVTVEKLTPLLPSAAKRVASDYGVDVEFPASVAEFVDPPCNGNLRLHSLGANVRSILVETESDVDSVIRSASKSDFVVAKIVKITRRHSQKELLTFALRTENLFAMTILHTCGGELLGDFVRRLREVMSDRKILVRDPTHFHELTLKFVSPFTGVIDLYEAAKNVNCDRSWNGLAQAQTQGPMCMRGAFVPGYERPSEVSREHEKIRLSLMYGFYRQYAQQIDAMKGTRPSARLLEKFRDLKK